MLSGYWRCGWSSTDTSGLSTMTLPTKVRITLEVWRYRLFGSLAQGTQQIPSVVIIFKSLNPTRDRYTLGPSLGFVFVYFEGWGWGMGGGLWVEDMHILRKVCHSKYTHCSVQAVCSMFARSIHIQVYLKCIQHTDTIHCAPVISLYE